MAKLMRIIHMAPNSYQKISWKTQKIINNILKYHTKFSYILIFDIAIYIYYFRV